MKNQSKNPDERCVFKPALPVLLFLVYVILDYFDVPSLMGLSSDRINMDFFSVFLNSVIVVVLYIITYYFIDRRQIQKDTNAKDTADILLLYTYKECLDNLEMVSNREWVEKHIIPKVDGDLLISDNIVITKIQNIPFVSKGEILELSKSGHIGKNVFAKYLHIQKEYKHIVAMKIVFYDLIVPQTTEQRELLRNINDRKMKLMKMLTSEIKRLDG